MGSWLLTGCKGGKKTLKVHPVYKVGGESGVPIVRSYLHDAPRWNIDC